MEGEKTKERTRIGGSEWLTVPSVHLKLVNRENNVQESQFNDES